MLDYILSLKTLLIAGAIGGVSGYLVSYLIDNYFLEPQTETDVDVPTIDNNYQRILNTFLRGIALICIWSGIFTAAAVFDYLLSFAPMSHGMRFLENETIATSLTWGFFAGMANTLLKIGEQVFGYFKQD